MNGDNNCEAGVTADSDVQTVSSTVVVDLGELDMGDPQVLSDFLVWTHTNYPAERMALVIWNHGDSWTMNLDGSAHDRVSQLVSSDDTDGNSISIAEGELSLALEAVRPGPRAPGPGGLRCVPHGELGGGPLAEGPGAVHDRLRDHHLHGRRVDQLAGLALADESLEEGLLLARADARGADFAWRSTIRWGRAPVHRRTLRGLRGP